MKNLRQKLYDKVNKLGVLGDVLNTEVTPKGLAYLTMSGIIAGSIAGCGYSTNSIKGIAKSPVTEKHSPYVLEEFSAKGIVYDTIEPREIKIDGEVYLVPCLVKRNDMREVIDDDGRIVGIRPYNVFGIIPVSGKNKKLRPVKLKEMEVDEKEYITVSELSLPKLIIPRGFNVIKRHSSDTRYNLNRLKLGESKKGQYVLNNNQPVFGVDTMKLAEDKVTEVIDKAGKSLETLPLGFIQKQGSLRILDRKDNNIKLKGYLFKPVKGELVTTPVAGNENKLATGNVILE